MKLSKKVLFIGISGYAYPHTRVRCYHFAEALAGMGLNTKVLSYRDHLGPQHSEADMYALSDKQKLILNLKAFPKLLGQPNALFYMQKILYHTGAQYLTWRLRKQPYVFDYDDYDIDFPCIFNRPWLNKFWFGENDYVKMTENIIRHSVCCVASSHFLMDYMGQFNPKVKYIPTGADLNRFHHQPRKEKETVRFIWTGVVWGDPILENIRFMFEAMKKLYSINPKVELQLVGGGVCWDQVEKWTKTDFAGVPIKLQSWVKHDEMDRVLNEADIGMMPLVKDSMWTRSKSPTKMFEYLATGLPVVAHGVGELSNILKDGETGFIGQTVDDFVDRMDRLARDVSLRKDIGIKAHQLIKNEYCLDVLSKRLYDLLVGLPV